MPADERRIDDEDGRDLVVLARGGEQRRVVVEPQVGAEPDERAAHRTALGGVMRAD